MSPRGTVGDLTAVRAVGSLLPPDLLLTLHLGKAPGSSPIPGLNPSAYHLLDGETLQGATEHAWSRLAGAWRAFRESLDKQPEGDPAVSLTRNKWLLPLFSELGYGRLPTTPAIRIGQDSFPISHGWGETPLHLLGAGVDLDLRTPGVAGAVTATPRALVQQLLNTRAHPSWGIVSNGRKLRLLRNSTSIATASYVEFDLEAIFTDGLFSEFSVLWLLLHQSRLEPLSTSGGEQRTGDCWLERWREYAIKEGAQALDKMRDGVEKALATLGTGFLSHPHNEALRKKTDPVQDGGINARALNRLLLRLVYRLLFLLVAESRDALHPPMSDPPTQEELAARERYKQFFSATRLRDRAEQRRGTAHGDLWQSLLVVFSALGDEEGLPELALPGLGGIFDPGSLDILEHSEISNEVLLEATRALTFFRQRPGAPLQRVDYRHLGAEELGSIYESLLELEPQFDQLGRTYTLEVLPGNERKSTGSYYTPSSLTELLLRTTLDPLLDEADNSDDPGDALLSLTICDPACGSGHFLVAAARRIATRLAAHREHEAIPSDEGVRHALHEVIDKCVYGVDRNPLAVELAKVSLWLEAMEPGKPLAFLDPQIRLGNALLGTTPALLDGGIPDAAFTALEGDTTRIATRYQRLNESEREKASTKDGDEHLMLFDTADDVHDPAYGLHHLASQLGTDSGGTLTEVRRARQRWEKLETSAARKHARLIADAWCAAFVWPKTGTRDATPVTHHIFKLLRDDPDQVPASTHAKITDLADQYQFFHWHLEFPGIFDVPKEAGVQGGVDPTTGWRGGFSCVAANPPWDVVEFEEKKFFSASDPEIAQAENASTRGKMISRLAEENPARYAQYVQAKRRTDGTRNILTSSNRYPGTGRGKVNVAFTFTELAISIIRPTGRSGVIVPTQISTGATTAEFFDSLVKSERLAALHDFENEAKLFPGVGNHVRFCCLTVNGTRRHADETEFSFSSRHPSQVPDKIYRIKSDEITLLNPNTGNCPAFRTRQDAEITLGIYRRHPVLVLDNSASGNPWEVRSRQGLFNMGSDSNIFRYATHLDTERNGNFDGFRWLAREDKAGTPSVEGEEYFFLPLYEGKFSHIYDHRYTTYEGATQAHLNSRRLPRVSLNSKQNPAEEVLPEKWVRKDRVEAKLAGWTAREWLLGWRDATKSVDSRTFIPGIVPRTAIGDKFLLLDRPDDAEYWASLLAILSSYAFDYVVRQKLTGSAVKFYLVKQLPVPLPEEFAGSRSWTNGDTLDSWVKARVCELVYTSWSVKGFAHDLGEMGPPFVWDVERRATMRAELDAMAFHVYGLERDEVEHVIDSFFVVRKDEEKAYGEFRSKRLILERYDTMASAEDGGTYTCPLTPAPGEGQRHSEGTRPPWADEN